VPISDELAERILIDKTDHKLTIARYHLNRVENKVSYNFDLHHFNQEYHLESFVIFSTMVIEALCVEINEAFNFDERLRIDKIISKLQNPTDKKQEDILNVISDYFSRPSLDLPLNVPLPNNTILWQLRKIRNRIAHFGIFNRAITAGSHTEYLIRFPRDDGKVIEKTINSPRDEFEIYFEKLVEFRDKIRKIIPQKDHSSLYKSLQDSELKSSLS